MKTHPNYLRRILSILTILIQLQLNAQQWRGAISSDSSLIRAKGMLVDGDYIYSLGAWTDTAQQKTYDVAIFKFDQVSKTGQVFGYELSRPMWSSWKIKMTPEGDLIVLVAGAYDYGVMKVDANGYFIWGKWFETPYPAVTELEIGKDGKIFLAGTDESVNALRNGFLVALDSAGNFLKYFNFNSPYQWNAQTHTAALLPVSEGGVLYAATMGMQYPASTMYLARISSSLSVEWQKGFGQDEPAAFSLFEADTGFYYAGTHYGRGRGLLLGKIGMDGSPKWDKVYKTGWALRPTLMKRDNHLFVSTYITSWDSITVPNRQLLAKFGLSGQTGSSHLFPDSASSTTERVNVDERSKELIFLKSASDKSITVMRTNGTDLSCLQPVQLVQVPHPALSSFSVVAAGDSSFITQGILTATFSGSQELKYESLYDCMITTGVLQDKPAHPFSLYPNPSHGTFYFTCPQAEGPVTISISDITGRVIETARIEATAAAAYKMSPGQPGIYFVHFRSEEISITEKIIINSK